MNAQANNDFKDDKITENFNMANLSIEKKLTIDVNYYYI